MKEEENKGFLFHLVLPFIYRFWGFRFRAVVTILVDRKTR